MVVGERCIVACCGAGEVGACQVGGPEVGDEVGAGQVGVGEDGAGQVGAAQVGVSEVGVCRLSVTNTCGTVPARRAASPNTPSGSTSNFTGETMLDNTNLVE